MVEHVIFHYEDEPQRVDLPGKIEVALYQHSNTERSAIDDPDDQQEFHISYRLKGENVDRLLRYVIDESIAGAERRGSFPAKAVMLHLVDRQMGTNAEAGTEIIKELRDLGIPDDQIWMVTAYEADARQDLRIAGINIFPKPSPSKLMVDAILKRLGLED